MFVLYELATGRAHSQSCDSFENPDTTKWGIKKTGLNGIWNPELLDFEPRPVDKTMSTLSFMELFTDVELVGILDAAKLNTQIELFILKLKQALFIDLNYQPTIDGVSALVVAGLLTAERATVILNG